VESGRAAALAATIVLPSDIRYAPILTTSEGPMFGCDMVSSQVPPAFFSKLLRSLR